jgi:hypothetical protein
MYEEERQEFSSEDYLHELWARERAEMEMYDRAEAESQREYHESLEGQLEDAFLQFLVGETVYGEDGIPLWLVFHSDEESPEAEEERIYRAEVDNFGCCS